MKLTLSYYEEAGTDRGGLDVALRVVLTDDQDPGTSDQAAKKAGAAFDEWLASAPGSEEEDELGVRVEDGFVKTCEASDYGFSVSQPVKTVRDLVCWLAQTGVGHGSPEYDRKREHLEGEWRYSLRTKLYTLTADLFRDGNAD